MSVNDDTSSVSAGAARELYMAMLQFFRKVQEDKGDDTALRVPGSESDKVFAWLRRHYTRTNLVFNKN